MNEKIKVTVLRKHYNIATPVSPSTCFGVVTSLMDTFLLLGSKLLFPLAEKLYLILRTHFQVEVLGGNMEDKKNEKPR